MSEFLLELYSEEIPPKLQINAREELKQSIEKSFEEESLDYKSIFSYSSPTRLTIFIKDVPEEINIAAKEIKGPKLGVPENILNSFELYSGLDGLYSMFSSEAFLLIFWIHFLAISLFLGAWISRDSQRYAIPKFFVITSLILTYFTGPVGLLIYWFIRIFFAKKINFND